MSRLHRAELLAGIVAAFACFWCCAIDQRAIDAGAPAADDAPPTAAESMAADLAKSTGTRHDNLVKLYRDAKGAQYTEVLALAIPQIKDEWQRRKVRQALAERLTRMKESTLKEYLKDENLEIRVAAARAAAKKRSKALIPQLIPLVKETRGGVAEAAHQALKDLSGQDFGPKADAGRQERVEAARQWSEWWKKQEGKKVDHHESHEKQEKDKSNHGLHG